MKVNKISVEREVRDGNVVLYFSSYPDNFRSENGFDTIMSKVTTAEILRGIVRNHVKTGVGETKYQLLLWLYKSAKGASSASVQLMFQRLQK